MITPAQCRAARGLIKWSQQNLADEARVGIVTVRQFESEQAQPREATAEMIKQAFERHGVEFFNGTGVKLHRKD